ncbi:hypothetical protein Bca52824_077455 [Brassica carinata]|uniref:Uncharacterized protein n=1 Tax=Brassica carinata TaxID=52824 RepID=A0A8X7PU24_BRACI|nr:hypothetical protein Bca52824_077455 [Brassica carinata]
MFRGQFRDKLSQCNHIRLQANPREFYHIANYNNNRDIKPFVPPEKKDQWWHAFIQHYYWEDQFHDEIYLKWKKQTQVTICGRISQKRRDNRQPSYMSTPPGNNVGKKMYKHGAGPRCFLNIEYTMMVDEGLDEPPSYTALARKTHTGKDGSFLDEPVEEMLQDGSPLGDSQTDSTAASNAKRYLLNQEYIKRGKTKKGTIYGFGSVQYKNSSASQTNMLRKKP